MTYYGITEFTDGSIVEHFTRVIAGKLITVTLTRKNKSYALIDTATINIENLDDSASAYTCAAPQDETVKVVAISEFETALKRAVNYIAREAGILNAGFVSVHEFEEALRQLYKDMI